MNKNDELLILKKKMILDVIIIDSLIVAFNSVVIFYNIFYNKSYWCILNALSIYIVMKTTINQLKLDFPVYNRNNFHYLQQYILIITGVLMYFIDNMNIIILMAFYIALYIIGCYMFSIHFNNLKKKDLIIPEQEVKE